MPRVLRHTAYWLGILFVAVLTAATVWSWRVSYTWYDYWCVRPKRYAGGTGQIDVVAGFCGGWAKGFFILTFSHIDGDQAGSSSRPRRGTLGLSRTSLMSQSEAGSRGSRHVRFKRLAIRGGRSGEADSTSAIPW